jgi:hypothetical protein
MARPSWTYRGFRRNAWRTARPRPAWRGIVIIPRVNNHVPPRVELFPPPFYKPYFCKRPRIKWTTSGAFMNVPYTDMRKQPRVYRAPVRSKAERRAS